MKVLPALLNNTPEEFVSQFSILQEYYNRFSIDIIDGKYADNKTISVDDIYELFFRKAVSLKNDALFDFDLMVLDYEMYLSQLKNISKILPIGNVFIHDTALNNRILPSSENITIGLSIDPRGKIDELDQQYNLNKISAIQIMTITPGFQGQSFKPELLDKIDQLREGGYRSSIYIDGSVNAQTIPIIKGRKYQPDYLCIGSYLTKAGDQLLDRVHTLQRLLEDSNKNE